VADFARPKEIVLKLDVQGYEAVVLRGAANFPQRVNLVIEAIFCSLYSDRRRYASFAKFSSPRVAVSEAFGVIREATSASLRGFGLRAG
jgi:hypothetical protein